MNGNHVRYVQNLLKINEMSKIIEYLKTEDSRTLIEWPSTQPESEYKVWVPTIEKSSTNGAFLTKTPEEIYNSIDAPIMDSMFSFMSQVKQKKSSKSISLYENFHRM